MYCANCNCAFERWRGRCPVCRAPMREESPVPADETGDRLSYAELLDLVRARGGSLEVALHTTHVGTASEQSFPYRGYGFAWARRMQGAVGGVVVDLRTTEVGKDREQEFPYFGFGYAWPQRLDGRVAGNPVTLTAARVCREKTRRFPYRGYGFAWTAEFAGDCGAQLGAAVRVTDVGRRMTWSFPYYGYGYAWEKEALLALTLRAAA